MVEVFNVLRVEAEHCGRQRAAQGIFPLGGQHRLQQRLRMQRLRQMLFNAGHQTLTGERDAARGGREGALQHL